MAAARHNFEALFDSLIKYLSQFWLEANSFSLNSCSDNRKQKIKGKEQRSRLCGRDAASLPQRYLGSASEMPH